MTSSLDEYELENETQQKKSYKLEFFFLQGKGEMGWVEQNLK